MVGVERPIKALSMHIQKSYMVVIVLALIAVILSKIIIFSTRLLHAYVQWVYIVSAKYQIAPSKAVVGVERPIKALSMHIQKSYMVVIVLALIAVILSKIIIFSTRLLHAYVQCVYIV